MAYPRHLLDECASGLLLFCSGRGGAADGHWFREAGLTDVTCVDWDEKTLEPFQAAYPSDWTYVHENAFNFMDRWHDRGGWDIVSADPPSQYRDRLFELLYHYCRHARKYVTATVMEPEIPASAIPKTFELVDVIPRASFPDGRDYFWAVLKRL